MPFSLHAPLYRYAQLLRFLISGSTAFFTNITLIYLFTEVLHVWYLTSSAIAFTGTFIVSFVMQKFWTFQNNERERMSAQLGMSLLLAVGNLGINTLLMYLLVDYFFVHYLLAVIFSTFVIAVETYFVYKYVIFLAVKEIKTQK